MVQKHILLLFIILSCALSSHVFSQREIPLGDEITEDIFEENDEADKDKDDDEIQEVEIYSVFNDFRIPTRENINTSDLRYHGWVTDQGMYTFRCRKGKRIRLTLWYLDKGPEKFLDSEFINITEAIDDCQKDDIEYKKTK